MLALKIIVTIYVVCLIPTRFFYKNLKDRYRQPAWLTFVSMWLVCPPILIVMLFNGIRSLIHKLANSK